MNGLHLKLRLQPPTDCDAAALGGALAALSAGQARELLLRCLGSRRTLAVGECFDVVPRDDGAVVIEGDLQRFHRLAAGWSGGQLTIDGSVGDCLASQMRAGRITLLGDAAAGAAEQMLGGDLQISGNVGDQLGRPLVGRRSGMSGGRVVVAGRCGHGTGYRMRRGTVLILGDCGDSLGCDLVAGTIVVAGSVGEHIGAGMRRGTLVVSDSVRLSPVRFTQARIATLGIARLLAADLMPEATEIAVALERPVDRALGDLTTGGMGEVWLYRR